MRGGPPRAIAELSRAHPSHPRSCGCRRRRQPRARLHPAQPSLTCRAAALAKEQNPVIGFWDPMGLADLPLWNQDEEAVIGARRRSRTAQALTARLGTLAHRRCASRLEGCRAQPSPDWQAGCATLRSSTGVSRWRASWATASTLTASSSRSRARRVSVRPSPLLQPSRASPCPPPHGRHREQQLQAAAAGSASLRAALLAVLAGQAAAVLAGQRCCRHSPAS